MNGSKDNTNFKKISLFHAFALLTNVFCHGKTSKMMAHLQLFVGWLVSFTSWMVSIHVDCVLFCCYLEMSLSFCPLAMSGHQWLSTDITHQCYFFLYFTTVNYRKLKAMQMIRVHRNANCVQHNTTDYHSWIVASFASIKQINFKIPDGQTHLFFGYFY